MCPDQPVRVLIADDHGIVRFGLKELINNQPGYVVVGEAANGSEAVEQALALRPDLVIMDVRMPDGDGITASRQILAELPATRVLVLTSYGDDEAVSGAILAGAAGYLLKQLGTGALVGALETIRQGGSLLDPAVTGRVFAQMKQMARHGGPNSLTPQEERILALMCEGRSNREIAQELHLSDNTARNYVSGVLGKLGVSSRSQAVAHALRHNLVPRSAD